MAKVTIEIDSNSITFAPLFLYWSGKGMFHHGSEWLIVPACFAVIGFFYILLGGAVIGELRKKDLSA